MVAVNDEDGPDDVARFVKYNGISYPVALDYNGTISYFYKAKVYGTVIIVNPETKRIEYKGPCDWKIIHETLAKLGVQLDTETKTR